MCLDFKQNITIPLASVETSTMFYGPARQEITCLAFASLESFEGRTRQKNIVFLTEIIEHTSLITGEFFLDVMGHMSGPGAFKQISAWHDCGRHFLSYQHVAFLIDKVFKHFWRPLRINYFCEKHGKGLIDGIFAHVSGWINSFLKQGRNQLISSFDELVRVCRAGPAQDSARDPTGVERLVLPFHRENKPETILSLDEPPFQIQKTYSLEVAPYDGRKYDGPVVCA